MAAAMSISKRIRKAIREGRVEFSEHALIELDNDDLMLGDVRMVLLHGAVHRTELDDPRGTRYIVRGAVRDVDVDIVCRFLTSDILWVITVYVVIGPEDKN